MAPQADDAFTRAAHMVADGIAPRQAWQQCGEPGGEAGIHNVRKARPQARSSSSKPVASAEVLLHAEAAPATPAGFGKGKPQLGYRLSSDQKEKKARLLESEKATYDAAYVAATLKWASMVQAGENGRGIGKVLIGGLAQTVGCADGRRRGRQAARPAQETWRGRLGADGTAPTTTATNRKPSGGGLPSDIVECFS